MKQTKPSVQNPDLPPVLFPVLKPQASTPKNQLIDFQNVQKTQSESDLLYVKGHEKKSQKKSQHIPTYSLINLQALEQQEYSIEQLLDDKQKQEQNDPFQQMNIQGSTTPAHNVEITEQKQLKIDTQEKSKLSQQQQIGVFRTNCIDCCDRTNVVQTYIARKVLQKQLLDIGIMTNPNDRISRHKEFQTIFNHCNFIFYTKNTNNHSSLGK